MDAPKDDFKWFGEGFDGFPKKLPEDVVEYMVFILDTQLSDTKRRERLQAFQRALTALEKKFLKEYIWQRESINLNLIRDQGRWMLKGTTNYGDSVADEWLIVWFLRELSKEFKDAWIRIYDTDGEFLLIEAANALPKWLNPEMSENRVWMNNHRLLVIPLSRVEEPRPLEQDEALKVIEVTPARPQHYPKIDKEAFHRLSGYPAAISENQHHVTLPLPRKVAHILHINPSFIAPIVEAFYLRDPISLRLLQPEKSKTPLIFPPEDFIQVSVRFTKVLYAQLLGQQWTPPGTWETALTQLTNRENETKAFLSIKVAAGLEMLAQHKIYADKKPVREIQLLLEDLDTGDDTLPTDADIATWPKREDDEGWLNIDFSEFEKELEGRGSKQGFGDKAAQENLKKMVERFNDFMNDEDAGIDGAEGDVDPMDQDNDSHSDASGSRPRKWEDPEDSDDDDDDDDDDESTAAATGKSTPTNSKGKTKKSPHGPASHDADTDSEASDSDENAAADAEFAEYEQALEKFMTLSAAEKALLTDEARELARAEEADKEEDEEIQNLSAMMEKELFEHGALKLDGGDKQERRHGKEILPDVGSGEDGGVGAGKAGGMAKGKGKGKGKKKVAFEDQDKSGDAEQSVGRTGEDMEDGDEEEDDDDDQLLDEDFNLADNMLKAFKGQAGMAGPAGNLMGLMGVAFPPDADDEEPRNGSSSTNANGKDKGRGKGKQRIEEL